MANNGGESQGSGEPKKAVPGEGSATSLPSESLSSSESQTTPPTNSQPTGSKSRSKEAVDPDSDSQSRRSLDTGTGVAPQYDRYAGAGVEDVSHAGTLRGWVTRTNVAPQYGKYAETDVVDVTHADKVRKLIVIWLLSLLSGTIVLGIAGVATAKLMGSEVADVRSFFEIVFSAIIALVSTAVGFYFATEARKQGPPKG